MIKFIDIDNSEPYKIFNKFYQNALELGQKNIEAVCISSFNSNQNEVSSRFVNLKYIKGCSWYFFTNYQSPKAKDFLSHKQVALSIFWNVPNVQIRIKGQIYLADKLESDSHFISRDLSKNALAISSDQSRPINSYDDVSSKYNHTIKNIIDEDNIKRPEWWGGFFIKPVYFEFWEGKDNRLNKREEYVLNENNWISSFLEP